VDFALHQIGDRLVYGPVSLEKAPPAERLGDDHAGVMAASRGGARMAGVLRAFVVNLQMNRREPVAKTFRDLVGRRAQSSSVNG
jgi:hypothetical protein